MSMPSTPTYVREDLFDALYSNISDLKDAEEYSGEVATKARNIQESVNDVEATFDELEEFNDTAVEYILWLEDLNSELGEELEEKDDIEESYVEDLLDDHLDRIEGLLDEYLSDIDDSGPKEFDGNYKSPTFNFGVRNPNVDTDNYMSPTFNFSSMPSGSSNVGGQTNIRPSWDDYNWGDGWSDTGEAKFDTPWDYAKTTGMRGSSSSHDWPSVEVNYEGEEDFQVVFDGSEVDLNEFDSTWEGAAS